MPVDEITQKVKCEIVWKFCQKNFEIFLVGHKASSLYMIKSKWNQLHVLFLTKFL